MVGIEARRKIVFWRTALANPFLLNDGKDLDNIDFFVMPGTALHLDHVFVT